MRAVNLLPRDEQRTRLQGSRTSLLVLAGGLTVVTVAAAMLGLSASSTADEKRSELQAIEAAIARLPKPAKPAVSSGTLTQERTDRIAALSAALSTRISFDRLFRQIAVVLPEDAWLTGLTAASPASLAPTPASPGAPSAPQVSAAESVTIQGATYSHASVARVLARLTILPALEDVRLTASAVVEQQPSDSTSPGKAEPARKKKAGKAKTLVTFTITASVRNGSAS
jgi:Tfp pilus assembly protein PilN